MARSTALLALLTSLAAPLTAADTAPPLAAPPPDVAMLFKSGQAFLSRRVPLAHDATTTRVELPAAIHGTVWLEADGAEIARAVTRIEAVDVATPVTGLEGLLRLAVDHPVTLDVIDGATIEGRVLRVLDGPRPIAPAFGPSRPDSSHVALAVGSRVHVLPIARITAVSIDAEPSADWTYSREEDRAVLDVRWARPVRGRDAGLRVRSLSGSLAWTPSYALELGEAETSRLLGKAVIVNDLEDLVDTQVRLVIGYPSFAMADVESSLQPALSLRGWIDQLERTGRPRTGHVMLTQGGGMVDVARRDAPAAVSLPGGESEDLFVYDAGRLTLARGERTYVPLSDQTVRHTHRFDWTLPDRVKDDRFASEPPQSTPVWHVLKLANGGDAPWTTAPILVVGSSGPLAQSTLHYTAAGTGSVVRLTQALDIVGREREVHAGITGERETVRLFGYNYERIEVSGALELRNHGSRTAPMRVEKSISGDVLQAGPSPAIDSAATGLGGVNARRLLTWELTLAPGETWSAEYRYAVLIRR